MFFKYTQFFEFGKMFFVPYHKLIIHKTYKHCYQRKTSKYIEPDNGCTLNWMHKAFITINCIYFLYVIICMLCTVRIIFKKAQK